LGYEALCREVADSISWQRFCRIPFGTRVAHPTTLMKLTTRCGDAVVAGLNEALLAKAADAKLLRTDKVRADTTVVEAAVAYPTDSGLLAKAVTTMARTVSRIQAAGGATRTRVRDRNRSASQRVRSIASVLRNARRGLRIVTGVCRDRLFRAINDLAAIMDKTQRVVTQARSRLAGVMPDSASRLVSFHDVDARPIRKDASVSRWSSGTKPRSSTMPMESSSTTPSRSVTLPMPRSWFRRSPGSPAVSDRYPGRYG
jgi:transposase, IS5 family